MQKIVGVIFNDAGKAYYYNPGSDEYSVGDYVVVETASDCALGKIDFTGKTIEEEKLEEPLKMVIRKATAKDIEINKKQREKIN